MKYTELLEKIIAAGIEEVEKAYPGDDPRNVAKRAGAIEGFNACRGKNPLEIYKLLVEAGKGTDAARSAGHRSLSAMGLDDEKAEEVLGQPLAYYWQQRYRELQIEWVLNCISAAEVLMGRDPLPRVITTTRAAMCVARIVGVTP